MSRTRYQICDTCYQRKDMGEYDLSKTMRSGHQTKCRECVLQDMRDKGVIDKHTRDDGIVKESPKKSSKQAYANFINKQKMEASKWKKINDARREYYKNKRAASVASFKEKFGTKGQ